MSLVCTQPCSFPSPQSWSRLLCVHRGSGNFISAAQASSERLQLPAPARGACPPSRSRLDGGRPGRSLPPGLWGPRPPPLQSRPLPSAHTRRATPVTSGCSRAPSGRQRAEIGRLGRAWRSATRATARALPQRAQPSAPEEVPYKPGRPVCGQRRRGRLRLSEQEPPVLREGPEAAKDTWNSQSHTKQRALRGPSWASRRRDGGATVGGGLRTTEGLSAINSVLSVPQLSLRGTRSTGSSLPCPRASRWSPAHRCPRGTPRDPGLSERQPYCNLGASSGPASRPSLHLGPIQLQLTPSRVTLWGPGDARTARWHLGPPVLWLGGSSCAL